MIQSDPVIEFIGDTSCPLCIWLLEMSMFWHLIEEMLDTFDRDMHR